ncbi:hypothetical protein [Sphingomonas melonis]|uniref:hypothetical protein n=1 Tax=Sphingomonas melonis TaxID=152682 RepID=UPI0035C7D01D
MGASLPEPDHQLKVPVVCRPVYTLYLEQATPAHTFIHCDIHGRWSPRIKRELIADWIALKNLHGGPLYALHAPADRKHLKFLHLFGFRRVSSFIDRTGHAKEIFST